jgi:aryl-alcohol dehydrogenase
MKITAAVVYEKSPRFTLETIDLDEPRDDEVLVRIAGAGICHTDLACRDQYFSVPLPCVLGHEGAGVVEKVGTRVTKVRPGDHVVLSLLSCGACPSCLGGKPSYCYRLSDLNFGAARADGSTTLRKGRKTIHGAFFSQSSFADFALANERNTVKVPKDVPIELLGPLGCGVQTGAGAVINTLRPEIGSSIAVFGVGGVGMSAILAAVARDCGTIIAVDVNPARLKLARELGATHTINPRRQDPVDAINRITGTGVDHSLECVGNPEVLRQAVDAMGPCGVCGLIGAPSGDAEARLDMDTLLFGRTVRGIIAGDSVPDIFIPLMIDLYKKGRFPFDRMIKFYPLSDINKAAADMEKGKTIKPVLRPGQIGKTKRDRTATT